MKLDFSKMEEKRIEGFKGGEGIFGTKMYADDSVKIMSAYLEPGACLGMHAHEGSTETVFILSGTGKMICDGVEEELYAGVCSHCAEGHTHQLINTGNERLVFYAVVPTV